MANASASSAAQSTVGGQGGSIVNNSQSGIVAIAVVVGIVILAIVWLKGKR